MKIVQYNLNGENILQRKATRMPENKLKKHIGFSNNDYSSKFWRTVYDAKSLMIKANGIGIAANQVGDHRNWFWAIISGRARLFVNAKAVEYLGPLTGKMEGCLSMPRLMWKIHRPDKVRISYYNIEEKSYYEEIFEGPSARVIMHELDHLNGKCICDRYAKYHGIYMG
jgi:peptide deformylase